MSDEAKEPTFVNVGEEDEKTTWFHVCVASDAQEVISYVDGRRCSRMKARESRRREGDSIIVRDESVQHGGCSRIHVC